MKTCTMSNDSLDSSWPNPWKSVDHFFAAQGLPHPRGDWRLTEYELGQVNGFPRSYGRVVCTNGIMCYIQLSNDSLFYGHFTAWMQDKTEVERVPKAPRTQASPAGGRALNLSFINF